MTNPRPVAADCTTAVNRAISEIEAALKQLKIARAATTAAAYEDALEEAAYFTELTLDIINSAPLANGDTPPMPNLDIEDLGYTCSIPEAAEILGVSANTARNLIKRGEFPIEYLQIGGSRRVVTASLKAHLGIGVNNV